MKRSSWCRCEETRDEYGGCVPKDKSMKKCIACGKKIPKNQLVKYKERMLKESGWEEEFEDTLLFQDDGLMELTTHCLEKLLEYFLQPIKRPSYLKNCRKIKVKIKARNGTVIIERVD